MDDSDSTFVKEGKFVLLVFHSADSIETRKEQNKSRRAGRAKSKSQTKIRWIGLLRDQTTWGGTKYRTIIGRGRQKNKRTATDFFRTKLTSTVLVLRMDHRIWKETKQEPGTAGLGNMLVCCLVSFHFLWAILSTSTVQSFSVIVPLLGPDTFVPINHSYAISEDFTAWKCYF